MNNPFQKIKEQRDAEAARQEEEQRQREERLRQLEEEKSQKGIHIPHPIKAAKASKEMKTLRKEIAAYEDKQKSKKLLVGCVAAMAVLFGFIGIMAVKERASSPQKAPAESSLVTEIDNDVDSSLETETEKEVLTEDAEEISSSAEITPSTEPIADESIMDEPNTEASISSDTDLPELLASDLNIQTQTDYAHTDSDIIFLGENEGVTITVTAPTGTSQDELVIYGDEDLLNISYEEVDDSTKPQFKIYVTGKKVCDTELIIATAYELEAKGEDASLYLVNIRKLDSSDGRIAYVTPSGEKYHFSASCAGENATKTTYRDCIAYEYEPCGKCAN